jgi:flavin-dependent dehydrogenase
MLGDEIAYIFPSDAGLTCVAVSVNLETFRWLRQDLEERYEARIGAHRGLAQRVAAARRDGRMSGCGPEQNYVKRPWGEGWALVGDAALHQDPWTGLGIDAAGTHATFLADAVMEMVQEGDDEHAALARYHERRNDHALEPFRETVRYAADLRQLSATA